MSLSLPGAGDWPHRPHSGGLRTLPLSPAASEPNLKVRCKPRKCLDRRKNPLTRKESAPPSLKRRPPEAIGEGSAWRDLGACSVSCVTSAWGPWPRASWFYICLFSFVKFSVVVRAFIRILLGGDSVSILSPRVCPSLHVPDPVSVP